MPFSKFSKNWTTADFLNAYQISLYTNRALNKRAEKVGETEFVLKRKNGEVVENDSIIDLLNKPNKSMSGPEFWALYQKYYDIIGEVYIYKEQENVMGGRKRINAMHFLLPHMVKPFFDKETGELTRVEYRTGQGTTTYQGEDIIYAHNPDPTSPLRGESLLRSGIRQIELATQIDEYHSKVLENGGRPEGVFNIKGEGMTQHQMKEVKDAYQKEYGSASESGVPLFLAGNIDYKRLGLNPAEMAYLETKKVNLDDIVYLTNVPRSVLGMGSEETYANADAAIRIFLRETIKPLVSNLTRKLDYDLFPSDDFELTFIDPTPENREEKRKDLETGNNIHALTTNEKREILGLEPITNGDTILAPMNLVPMSNGESTEPEQRSISTETKDNKKINHPLRNKDNRRIYHALQVKRLDRRQKQALEKVKEYFEGQEGRIIAKLDTQKHFRKKDLLEEIFETKLEISLAKETILPVLEQLLFEAAEDSKEIAGSDWEFNKTAAVEGWMDNKASIFAEQINETTFKKLKSEFAASLSAGETRQDLIKRIRNTYGDITQARAETIARTEVHAFTQKGTLEGYRQANLPIKIWVWAPGTQGGVRDNHQAMDGEEVDLNAAFSNGQVMPGEGSAGEVINCQCFI